MGSIVWSREIAEVYDQTYAATFEPSALDPMLDRLVELAGGGPALELAVGTGRVALPLARRGVTVCGIELSPDMVEQLRRKPGSDAVPVTIGDMTDTRVRGDFHFVYPRGRTTGSAWVAARCVTRHLSGMSGPPSST